MMILAVGLFISGSNFAQLLIEFPDIPGYKTLKCEFHQHTVFSDGSVWPGVRVAEAARHGLDAISITDHLEYQPHKEEIPHPNRNIGFEMATRDARDLDLMVINGAEITRGMPPGHLNAIFIEDANKLLDEDAVEVMKEAKKQGAFIFWNHPNWTAQKPDGVSELTEMHRQLINEGLIDGIEIVNSDTYSDEAFQIAIDNNLTILGNTDVHGMVEWSGLFADYHRPVNLVFATEKTAGALKEALEMRRTAVWFNNTLFGSAEFLVPLIRESLSISDVEYGGNSSVLSFTVENNSDATYIFENKSDFTLHSHAAVFMIKPGKSTLIQVKTIERLDSVDLPFKVLNAFTAPGENAEVVLRCLLN